MGERCAMCVPERRPENTLAARAVPAGDVTALQKKGEMKTQTGEASEPTEIDDVCVK